jgi:hypothetical protein
MISSDEMERIRKHYRTSKPYSRVLKKIASSPIYSVLSDFRCGFELECHEFNGKTRELWDSVRRNRNNNYDLTAFEEAVARQKEVILELPIVTGYTGPGSEFASVQNREADGRHRYAAYYDITQKSSRSMAIRFIKHRYPRQFPDLKVSTSTTLDIMRVLLSRETKVKDYLEFLREKGHQFQSNPLSRIERDMDWIIRHDSNSVHYVDLRAFPRQGPMPRQYESYQDFMSDGVIGGPFPFELMDIGTDGTVRGPEIRTRGGLTVQKFCMCAEYLSKNKIVVDTGCSFHIHLSVKGFDWPNYDSDFHLALWEGLFNHYHELPESIKTRMRNPNGRRYFQTMIGNDRYYAIAYRGNTWEFRLFGNTADLREQKKCLMVAIRAMQWAIRAKYFGLERRYLVDLDQIYHNSVLWTSLQDLLALPPSSKKSWTEITMEKLRPKSPLKLKINPSSYPSYAVTVNPMSEWTVSSTTNATWELLTEPPELPVAIADRRPPPIQADIDRLREIMTTLTSPNNQTESSEQ